MREESFQANFFSELEGAVKATFNVDGNNCIDYLQAFKSNLADEERSKACILLKEDGGRWAFMIHQHVQNFEVLACKYPKHEVATGSEDDWDSQKYMLGWSAYRGL